MTLLRHDEVVLLLGAPGAGKGRQARGLAERLGARHVASGDLLREHCARGTDLGRAATGYMQRGDLVPDHLVVSMVLERLARPDAARGVLLDGFPRTLAQAEALDEGLAARGGGVRAAVFLDVPERVLVERMAGRWLCRECQRSYHERFDPPARPGRCDVDGAALFQRADDRREVVGRRVAVYLRETLPVIEHYERLGLLRRVDGDGRIAQVERAMAAAVGVEVSAAVAA